MQTENTDPPPNESQPSGKIRKGFKLFGKRKPGNIFSIRNKGDGNNKSPVIRSKTMEGLSETPAPDSQSDREKGQDGSQGEKEQAEDETLGEDGVVPAAAARNSISSACSAKSLTFLSLLRGGRRGVGDRRVHTVSQPVGRQRRGLKGLFGNGKFRLKDKEEKEEAPPSPLLMSSRANSVEIIKEDLTLTPKFRPRSLDSPETDSCEPVQSYTALSSSPGAAPLQVTTVNVSRSHEHMLPSPTSEPPLVPGDNSLSSLLADISSLLTFDSISGGGDIMADVEAEWGKASSAISAAVTHVSPSTSSLFSKPTVSSKPAPTVFSVAATAKPFPSSTISKPSATLSTFTTSSTLTSQSVKLSSDSVPASVPSVSIAVKSAAPPATTRTAPVTLTSFSAPGTSASKTVQFTLNSTFASPAAPSSALATVVKAPSVSPPLISSAGKLASEISSPPQNVASVSKPESVTASLPASTIIPPVTQTPPISVAQPSAVKLDSVITLNQQKSSSYTSTRSSAVGDSKALETVSTACVTAVTTKPSFPESVIPSKMATVSTSATTSGSVFTTLSKPSISPAPLDLKTTPRTPVTVSAPGPSPTLTSTTKTQPSAASVPPLSSASLDKIPPMTKPITVPISLDKMSPAPTAIPAASTPAVSTKSPTPAAVGQITLGQSVVSSAPAQISVSLSKELASPTQKEVIQSTPSPAQAPVSITRDPPAPVKIQAASLKDSSVPAHIPVSTSKVPPDTFFTNATAAPARIPVSLCVDHPAPVCFQVSVSKTPVPAQITISQLKVHPAPTTAAPPPPPAPSMREAPDSAKRLAHPEGQGSQAVPAKTKQLDNEPQTTIQGPPKEKKAPQVKASGLSKIPVVGGGRGGKAPVRESQPVSDEPSREPTTPVLEERPHFNSYDAGSKDKISTVEASVASTKHTQEENQQPPQPKVLSSSARDSKIPVKHGTQSHAASQISQTKEPPRTKIPVSKVPVRKVGNKPAPPGGAVQTRK